MKCKMPVKKKAYITYPSSEKIYIPGDINKIKVGMRQIKLERKLNNPVIVYDTSGPYSDPVATIDFGKGIARIREEWCPRRKDIVQPEDNTPYTCSPWKAKSGKTITQMYYAKKRTITPEMEYTAIRENQQIEALGLKSYITPDFVRKEVAAGRAVIPANINHPEVEPMIIGNKFLVKVNMNLGDTVERMVLDCKWGCDMLTDLSASPGRREARERILRNSPVPIGTVPLYQALEKVNGDIEALDWKVYKEALIEQAEQGADMFTVHAAMLRKHLDLVPSRLNGIVSPGGSIMAQWMKTHKKENFLYTHFAGICEIARDYDVILSIGSGLRPGAIYDSNDTAQYAELKVMKELTAAAWEQFVQVITEGSGHVPMNRIPENIKEQQYNCNGAPFYTFGPVTTDIAPGYDHITSSIGAALAAWHGASMVSCTTSSKEVIIAHKIAAHAADLAKEHPGAQVRDNAISKACFEGRRKDRQNLSIDPFLNPHP